jgi:hypothetical protein
LRSKKPGAPGNSTAGKGKSVATSSKNNKGGGGLIVHPVQVTKSNKSKKSKKVKPVDFSVDFLF